MPINGSWVGFTNKGWTNNDIKAGAVWQSTWWPATGRRNSGSATLTNVAHNAYYWSSSPRASDAYRSYTLYFDCNGTVAPSNNEGSRSFGFPLRCVQE